MINTARMATFEGTFGGFIAEYLVGAIGTPYLTLNLRETCRTMRDAISAPVHRTPLALAKHGASRGSLIECEIARDETLRKTYASQDDRYRALHTLYHAIMYRAAKYDHTGLRDAVRVWPSDIDGEKNDYLFASAMMSGAACRGDEALFREAHEWFQKMGYGVPATAHRCAHAAKHNHINILKLAQELGADMRTVGNVCMPYYNMQFTKYVYECGQLDLSTAIEQAAIDAREDVIGQLREWGADSIGPMMRGAAIGGHVHLCEAAREWARERGVEIDLERYMLQHAAYGGHVDICRLAREWGAHDYESMLRWGVYGGRRAICVLAREWLIESGAIRNDEDARRIMDHLLINVAHHYNLEFAILAREFGAHNFHTPLYEAASFGYVDFCKLMRKWMEERGESINVNVMISRAAERVEHKTIELAREWAREFGVTIDIACMLENVRDPAARDVLAAQAREW